MSAAIIRIEIRAGLMSTPSASLRAITAENYWGKPPTAKLGGLYHAQIPDINNEIGDALRRVRCTRTFGHRQAAAVSSALAPNNASTNSSAANSRKSSAR